MAQSTAMMTEIGRGFMPLASGIAAPATYGFEGVPGLGTFPGMLLQPQFAGMMGAAGMMPMGIGHDQNVYDVMMRQRFTQMQMLAMQNAAQMDKQNYMNSFRGVAALTGTPWGAPQYQAASSLAGFAAMASPMLAGVMPEFLDALSGPRGSATVMARSMIDAGRYRIDPVTGRMGVTEATAGLQTTMAYQDLFAGRNYRQMGGVTAGQAGGLYEALQMRGMVGASAAEAGYGGYRGDDPRGLAARSVFGGMPGGGAAASRLSTGDIDKLMLDPAVADRMRTLDVDKIKRSIQAYSGAVSAMRDIFGDMGRPNAPMQELMAGLEALTMGSMAQVAPHRLAGMARQTYNLAKQTGVGMDATMVMQQHAAVRAQEMGLEPIFAVQATQGALAFGGAYRAQGHAASTAWGAKTADQLVQLDTNLRVQAAGSNAANRMNLALRISDTMGGIKPGSEAASYIGALRSGMGTYRDATGTSRSINVSDQAFMSMFAGAGGLGEADIHEMLAQRTTNREYGDRYGTAALLRRTAQPAEVEAFVATQLQDTFTGRFTDVLTPGMGRAAAFGQARTMSGRISAGVAGRMNRLSTAEFNDTTRRNAAMSAAITAELETAGHGDFLRGMAPEDRARFLTQTSERAFGYVNRAFAGSTFAALGDWGNAHRLGNAATLDETQRQDMQAAFTGRMQTSMAALGRGSMLSRAVDAIQDIRPGDEGSIMKVIARTLGGVSKSDINERLAKPMVEVQAKRAALQKLQTEAATEKDPEKRAALMRSIDVQYKELDASVATLREMGEKTGFFTDPGVTREASGRAVRTADDLDTFRVHIANMAKTDYSITPEQRKKFTDLVPAFKGKPEAEIDVAIWKGMKVARDTNFGNFWANDEGKRFRASVEMAGQDVETVAMQLLTPAAAGRFGSQAPILSSQLSATQLRLRELALFHAGGDVTRLVAGNLSIDTSTEKGRKLFSSVQTQVQDLLNAQASILNDVNKRATGKEYRQFQLGHKDLAIENLKKAGTPLTEENITKERERMGNYMEARRVLAFHDKGKIDPDKLASATWDVGMARRMSKEDEATLRAWKDKPGDPELRRKAEEIASREGALRPEDMLGALTVFDAATGLSTEALRREEMDPVSAIKGMYKAYGVEAPETTTQTMINMQRLMGTSAGRGFVSRLTAVRKELTAMAGGKEVEALASDYAKAARGTDADMKKFREAYGMTKDEDFARFKDLEGYLKLGVGGRFTKESDVLDMFSAVIKGGDVGGVSGPGGRKGPESIRIDGKVTIDFASGTMSFTDVWGGSRVFTPGGG